MSTMTGPTIDDAELRTKAIERLERKREFWSHLAAYVLVNATLVVVWAMTGSGFFWPAFPLLGWGIGLFFHGWQTYTAGPREERIRREMDHLRAAR
jgi:hypothetical protein